MVWKTLIPQFKSGCRLHRKLLESLKFQRFFCYMHICVQLHVRSEKAFYAQKLGGTLKDYPIYRPMIAPQFLWTLSLYKNSEI